MRQYAPVSGVVEEVNSKLAEQPGLLNKSPEDQGWLCRIKIKDAAEVRIFSSIPAVD